MDAWTGHSHYHYRRHSPRYRSKRRTRSRSLSPYSRSKRYRSRRSRSRSWSVSRSRSKSRSRHSRHRDRRHGRSRHRDKERSRSKSRSQPSSKSRADNRLQSKSRSKCRSKSPSLHKSRSKSPLRSRCISGMKSPEPIKSEIKPEKNSTAEFRRSSSTEFVKLVPESNGSKEGNIVELGRSSGAESVKLSPDSSGHNEGSLTLDIQPSPCASPVIPNEFAGVQYSETSLQSAVNNFLENLRKRNENEGRQRSPGAVDKDNELRSISRHSTPEREKSPGQQALELLEASLSPDYLKLLDHHKREGSSSSGNESHVVKLYQESLSDKENDLNTLEYSKTDTEIVARECTTNSSSLHGGHRSEEALEEHYAYDIVSLQNSIDEVFFAKTKRKTEEQEKACVSQRDSTKEDWEPSRTSVAAKVEVCEPADYSLTGWNTEPSCSVRCESVEVKDDELPIQDDGKEEAGNGSVFPPIPSFDNYSSSETFQSSGYGGKESTGPFGSSAAVPHSSEESEKKASEKTKNKVKSPRKKRRHRSFSSSSSGSSSKKKSRKSKPKETIVSVEEEREKLLQTKMAILKKVWVIMDQKKKLNQQKEEIESKFKGSEKQMCKVLEENMTLSKEITKQIYNMNSTINDINKKLGIDTHYEDFFRTHLMHDVGSALSSLSVALDLKENSCDSGKKKKEPQKSSALHSSTESASKHMLWKPSDDDENKEKQTNIETIETTHKLERAKEGKKDSKESRKYSSNSSRKSKRHAGDDSEEGTKSSAKDTGCSKKGADLPEKDVRHSKSHMADTYHMPSKEAEVESSKKGKGSKEEKASKSPEVKRALTPPDHESSTFTKFVDPGFHWCDLCNEFVNDVKQYMFHLSLDSHVQLQMKRPRPWLMLNHEEKSHKPPPDVPILTCTLQGVEFVRSTVAFYCSLCHSFFADEIEAANHPESGSHVSKYKEYLMKNQMYEAMYTKDKMTAYWKYAMQKNSVSGDARLPEGQGQASTLSPKSTASSGKKFSEKTCNRSEKLDLPKGTDPDRKLPQSASSSEGSSAPVGAHEPTHKAAHKEPKEPGLVESDLKPILPPKPEAGSVDKKVPLKSKLPNILIGKMPIFRKGSLKLMQGNKTKDPSASVPETPIELMKGNTLSPEDKAPSAETSCDLSSIALPPLPPLSVEDVPLPPSECVEGQKKTPNSHLEEQIKCQPSEDEQCSFQQPICDIPEPPPIPAAVLDILSKAEKDLQEDSDKEHCGNVDTIEFIAEISSSETGIEFKVVDQKVSKGGSENSIESEPLITATDYDDNSSTKKLSLKKPGKLKKKNSLSEVFIGPKMPEGLDSIACKGLDESSLICPVLSPLMPPQDDKPLTLTKEQKCGTGKYHEEPPPPGTEDDFIPPHPPIVDHGITSIPPPLPPHPPEDENSET